MAQTAQTTSRFGWITTAPAHVPDDLVRYYVYWRIFYILAGTSHFVGLLLFAQAGVWFMVYFNVFSVSIFAGALLMLKFGYYRLAFWGAFAELTLHGISATICVGPDYSFQNFTFLVVILLFIQPFYSMRFSLAAAALTLAGAGALMYYTINNPPVYMVPEHMADRMVVTPIISWPLYVLVMVLPFVRASARAEKELAAAYGESERLLLNILPKPIAARLKATEGMIADDYDRVAVLFADIVGFTRMSDRLQPAEVVKLLNDVFNAIDELVVRYGVEKIKTIGDAYMVVAGLPDPVADPDDTIARLALDIQAVVSKFKDPVTGEPVQVRIGINSGKVVAGVIGNRKFAYDLWGDAVNVAARMESTGEVGRIQVTDDFAAGLGERYRFEPRGAVDVKGKGRLTTSYLVGAKETGRLSAAGA